MNVQYQRCAYGDRATLSFFMVPSSIFWLWQYVDEKFTHQVIYFNIKLSIFYVKVKIYTSSLLHCYQMPIFKLESTYYFVHQSEGRYCNVSVADIFIPSSPIFINQERLVSSFLLVCLMRMHWRENFGAVFLRFQRMFSPPSFWACYICLVFTFLVAMALTAY